MATQLMGAATAVLASIGASQDRIEAKLKSDLLQTLRSELGDEEFEREYQVGKKLSWQEAIQIVLQTSSPTKS